MSERMVVGRYRLARPLGRGGMGAVWQAHDTLLGREVALKEIYFPGAGTEPVAADDPLVRRALREAQAAARLRHPGIVTVHDVVTEDGRPWIVMELVDGRSLAEDIRAAGLLSVQRTAEVGLTVLDALQAAHRDGVLHRDVKPANILLDTDRVVLTDFGIAAIDDATALTVTGQMVGSPAFLAPERINGRPATPAADLWALGVTLHTALTGRNPFQREDTQTTIAAILTVQPEPPAHAGQLWPVIKGLLEKDPDRRLTAAQARPLLAVVAEAPGARLPAPQRARSRRRGRFAADEPEPTAAAPPPTVAAETAAADGAATVAYASAESTAPIAALAGRRPVRRGTLWGAGVAVLLALGVVPVLWAAWPWPGGAGEGAGEGVKKAAVAPASPPASPSAPVNPLLDPCVVGTWRMTSMQVVNNVDSVDVQFSGKGGMTVLIEPDGRAVDDYSSFQPLTAKLHGARLDEVIRGKITYRIESRGGRLYVRERSGKKSYVVNRNGRKYFGGDMVSSLSSMPYSCVGDRLTTYGEEGYSTQSFARVSG